MGFYQNLILLKMVLKSKYKLLRSFTKIRNLNNQQVVIDSIDLQKESKKIIKLIYLWPQKNFKPLGHFIIEPWPFNDFVSLMIFQRVNAQFRSSKKPLCQPPTYQKAHERSIPKLGIRPENSLRIDDGTNNKELDIFVHIPVRHLCNN